MRTCDITQSHAHITHDTGSITRKDATLYISASHHCSDAQSFGRYRFQAHVQVHEYAALACNLQVAEPARTGPVNPYPASPNQLLTSSQLSKKVTGSAPEQVRHCSCFPAQGLNFSMGTFLQLAEAKFNTLRMCTLSLVASELTCMPSSGHAPACISVRGWTRKYRPYRVRRCTCRLRRRRRCG